MLQWQQVTSWWCMGVGVAIVADRRDASRFELSGLALTGGPAQFEILI
jgi:hypothetical protein